MDDETDRWNHNIHYHPVLLSAIPDAARDALDVGCGEGMLTRRLAQRVPHVVGIDLDEAGVRAAEAASQRDGVDYVLGDFLTYPFEPESFDAVVSVATLHHMDATAALTRMTDLLRPGGTLALLGCARASRFGDFFFEVGGVAAHKVQQCRHGIWDHPSPTVWPPPVTYRQMRELAARLLPGSRYRRHLLWRYSLVWSKPAA